jgi:Cu-Zn family superoxide dismutase
MMTLQRTAVSLGLAAILSTGALFGCREEESTTTTSTTTTSGSSSGGAGQAGARAQTATATLEPSKAPGQDNVAGTVTFTKTATGVKVHADVTGLTPNGKHGFHIHEKGDLSAPDLTSAGAHFNPGGHKHGGPTGSQRHGGDLGNLEADGSGKASYDAVIEGITIDDPTTGVVGKSVIVHEKADDLTSDPSGNSGARIAGGVIKVGS